MSTQTPRPLALVPSPGDPSTEPDPIPSHARAVIDLFATHLAKVQFPDVDSAALRKLADDVRAEATSVARAREALAAAVAASEARVASLTSACARAVAYARVFGEALPERRPIVEAIAALDAPGASAQPLVRRRGRPRKTTSTVEMFEAPKMEAGELNPPTR